MNVVPYQRPKGILEEYEKSLAGKSEKTVDAYMRALRQFTTWIADRPGNGGLFRPEQLTKTAIEMYLALLQSEGYSVSHLARVKSAVGSFARWLMEEKEILRRNPIRGVEIPAQPLLAPRQLSPDQRYILRSLVERDGNPRSEALFALGYWAGCRVSDVSWLQIKNTNIGPKVGWLSVGYKGNKMRDIDLLNQARSPLYKYIQHGGRDPDSPYVFTSQRADRLTEAGIHHWFRTLKSMATKDEWELILDITFHDLRHDFAHRAREAGWTLEEIAYYLGHVTKKGMPAIQTTIRYTQASREQIKEKLKQIKG
ncbi:tyrosine-type recombinase/integrase [Ammoniphilus sp. YIM 78166]|uniref:tyrosine-type recombinase/integrase n=1 Tax=Ammoniphilus sp. YIM 78166 TaxID=1644106 RepID=UPI00196ADCD4|nr:tyrosine-type recombinase/integrase [Ammoniphilus sp. YIM 78166]